MGASQPTCRHRALFGPTVRHPGPCSVFPASTGHHGIPLASTRFVETSWRRRLAWMSRTGGVGPSEERGMHKVAQGRVRGMDCLARWMRRLHRPGRGDLRGRFVRVAVGCGGGRVRSWVDRGPPRARCGWRETCSRSRIRTRRPFRPRVRGDRGRWIARSLDGCPARVRPGSLPWASHCVGNACAYSNARPPGRRHW